MPQKVLKFAGINMNVDEFQSSGACEELINLRPEIGGGNRCVKHKTTIMLDVPYDAIYEHSFGDKRNTIAITNGEIRLVYNDGSSTVITSEFKNKSGVSVHSAGNILLAYCKETNNQLVFKFEEDKYSAFKIGIKPIINTEIAYAAGTAYNVVVAEADNAASYSDALQKAASGFCNKFPNGLCGAAVVGCTYELKDGSEVWSTAFVVANGEFTSGYQQPSLNTGTKEVSVSGARKVYLCVDFDDKSYDEIKKINVYASRPVFPYDVENTTLASFRIVSKSLSDMNLGGQVMYYQGSISPEKQSDRVLLSFGTAQASEKIMDVTSGCIERIGESVSYNNRFHVYKDEVKHIIQQPTVSRDYQYFIVVPTSENQEQFHDYELDDDNNKVEQWICYVNFNGTWKLINKVYKFFSNLKNDFIYPMTDVKKLAFVKATESANGSVSVLYNDMFYVDLSDSFAYNYSCAFEVTPTIVSVPNDFYKEISDSGQLWGANVDDVIFWKKESNALNVSAPFNPFVFPVNYSYSFGGEILDITTTYLPISSTQAGQYPITVFTKNGVYALEQGGGDTLYSNVVPLQPQVIDGKATTTPYGTFFVSSNNLFMLMGRETINISHILDGDRELRLRDNESYKRLCCTQRSILYNFSELLSKDDFNEFISDVSMVYDQFNNELIISSNNPDIRYSYVFNINTKSFHKIGKKYLGAQNGSRYAIEISGDSRNVVDMHKEIDADEQPILLQSRPLNLEAFGTHIQRLIMLLDARLTGDQYLFISVFGSDNLYDWNCITSAQKHNVALRQIRTNRAARTYRDYIILINGVVSTDTDLSEIIADYTVVSRRLG